MTITETKPSAMLKCVGTGLVYRNPKPHLRSRQTFHPTIVELGKGELLCAFDIAEAIESFDYRTHLARSKDGGATWKYQGSMFAGKVTGTTTSSVRIQRLRDGTLIGFGGRYHRNDPEEGQTNRETLGQVPVDLILLRSRDRGHIWNGQQVIRPPLASPSFEICHNIVELPGGRWLAPTATWRGWNGELPSGQKTIALISDNHGKSWPRYGVIFDGAATGRIHWEVSVVSLGGDRVLAVAWAHDSKRGRNLPTPYAISEDGGLTFSVARPTGLRGQTCKLLALRDGRILAVYRRDDRPGLWANLSRLEGNRWVNEAELPLWGTRLSNSGMTGETNSVEDLSNLKFGFPQMVQLTDQEVFVVFWCLEDGIHNIRWIRLRV